MEHWVHRALARWPNVPALYGWLALDRRGRWLIRGEPITRPQIIDTINPNYAADERGCWYFQNGPQRGYVALEYAPLLARPDGSQTLRLHTGEAVEEMRAAWIDEDGALLLETSRGPALLDERDLAWALQRLSRGDAAAGEDELAAALATASGRGTELQLAWNGRRLPVGRCDFADMPQRFGFVREPRPL